MFEDADVAIYLSYGIGDPQKHQFSYTLPVYGQTGVSSSTTTGIFHSDGSFHATTIYTPTYGITGYTTHTKTYETYFRFFVLEAVDVNKYIHSLRIVPVWKTTVTSTGSSGDLRRVFPVLVAAAKPYIGTNTGKKVEVSIMENSKEIAEIRN